MGVWGEQQNLLSPPGPLPSSISPTQNCLDRNEDWRNQNIPIGSPQKAERCHVAQLKSASFAIAHTQGLCLLGPPVYLYTGGRQKSQGLKLGLGLNVGLNPATSRCFSTERRPSVRSRYRQLIKEYGVVALGFHSTLWVATLAASYVVVSQGIDVMQLVDSVPFIEGFDVEEYKSLVEPAYANFFVAYCFTALTGPVRIAIDVVATPWLASFPLVKSVSKQLEDTVRRMTGRNKEDSGE